VFHNTTPDLQDQDQDRLFWSDRACPKTDGLRAHHWRSRAHYYYYYFKVSSST